MTASDLPTARSEGLDAACAEARRRWPGIAFDQSSIARALAERLPPPSRPGADRDHEPSPHMPPFAVEFVLARACLTGDAVAIRAFHDEMFARVGRVLARLGVTGSDADDIIQDVRAKLLIAPTGEPKLALYQGSGPLAQWVASVAGREALTALRRRRPLAPLDDDDLLDATDDPQMITLKARHGAELKAAFQAAVGELEPRARAVLRALIVDNRTVNDIAALYGIHRVTASRQIADIRTTLLDATRRRLRQQLTLADDHLDSAIRLIDSNLDLSLYRLLADAA